MIKKIIAVLLFLLAAANTAFADEEAGNRAYVQSSEYGLFYGKSVPAEPYGLKGKTQIFQVIPEQDQLLYTYDWYSPEIFISGFTAGPTVYVVKFGAWNRGHVATSQDLAVAFYKNDKLLKEYSTLDIAQNENNVSASVSHYTVFNKKLGFRRPWGNQLIFDVERDNSEVISFDLETGEIISPDDEKLHEKIYQTVTQIEQLKWKWHELKKGIINDIDQYEITEDDLKAVDPDNYPKAPEGYKIVPHKMWTQTEIIKL